jgi:hypothetical protein
MIPNVDGKLTMDNCKLGLSMANIFQKYLYLKKCGKIIFGKYLPQLFLI